jgi:hypothetical protein
MPIHQAFHMEMQHAFTMNATQVWFSLYSGAFDPMSLQIVALFDEIAAGLEYYEVIDNTPTRQSFPKVVERIKFLQ